jgi:carbonic anhydrase/acetyltransferase-like protein (isoleucine patch superfamily)
MLYSFGDRKPVIGRETYVSETAMLIGDVRIGNNCYIGHGVILRGDYGTIDIGNGTTIEEGVVVHAPPEQTCWIGEKVTVGHGAVVHSKLIGDFTVIGMGAILSIKAEIGEHSIVAEGSVVRMNQKISDGLVFGGNPARRIREISRQDEDFWGQIKQDYINLAKKYLSLGMHRLG